MEAGHGIETALGAAVRSGHDRFFDLLSQVPRIAELWDRERKILRQEAFEQALGTMSSGEVQMARFFAAVWYHNNREYGFDVVDAAARIDPEYRELIARWVMDPFWP